MTPWASPPVSPHPLRQPGHSRRIRHGGRVHALHCLGALDRLNTKEHHARHASLCSVAEYPASPAKRDPLCRRRLSPCAASACLRVRRLPSSQLVCRRSRLLGQSGLNKESPDSRRGALETQTSASSVMLCRRAIAAVCELQPTGQTERDG